MTEWRLIESEEGLCAVSDAGGYQLNMAAAGESLSAEVL